MKKRWWTAAAVWFAIASGCSGDGCDCMSPTPGGFPSEARTPNMVQIRLTSGAISQIEADPGALLGGLLGGGGLTFDVPADCAADANPQTCCDSNGNEVTPCGPIEIDLDMQGGDPPRLELNPQGGQSMLDLVVRARVRTAMPVPVNIDLLLGTANCDLTIDTERESPASITLRAPIEFVQNARSGTTDVVVGAVTIEDFTTGDVALDGGLGCSIAEFGLTFFQDTLVSTFEDAVADAISEQLCKTCPSGDVAECGPFADTCENQVCMQGSECLQELGVAGRLAGNAVLGDLSPGTLGAIDLYEVAGGYATTDDGGIALGLLGGFQPGGEERDRCGPPSEAPAATSIPVSSFFQGNTRPDTGAAYDVGIGVHQQNLDQFAWAAYEGGFLCLSIGTNTIDLLNSDTMAILMPSLIDLLHGDIGQLYLGLRPQSPPQIVLGEGTFIDDGMGGRTIDDPLLGVSFTDLDLDFFAMVDDQFIRVMTLTSDVTLPINLEVDENGEIVPVLGDLEEAFTNLRVTNSEALAESPAELEDKFPAVLSLALPLIADGLGGFALPDLGGLTLSIPPDGITSVDNTTFLAIYGDLVVGSQAAPAPRVETEAELTELAVPEQEAFLAERWDERLRPRVRLALGGTTGDGLARELEWSHRVDGGLWSPYSRARELTLSPRSFWLQGRHTVEVRAREVGAPLTTDTTPVVHEIVIDRTPPRAAVTGVGGGEAWVVATDNVSRGRLRVEVQGADGVWYDAGTPGRVELGEIAPEQALLRVVDEAGNVSPAVTGEGITVGFHGSAGDSGCNCRAGGGAGSGGAALLVIVCLGLAGARRRRRAAAAAVVIATVALGSLLPACSCGGTKGPDCIDECLEGEVERGPTGRWASIAASEGRVVATGYDETLGDLVMIEVADGELVFTAVAGVPDEAPTYEPTTYRGGVVQPGPDVGAWTSVALSGDDRARIAFQDRETEQLMFAVEDGDGDWEVHAVDPDDVNGVYASLALDGGDVPAIAYMALGLDDGAGGKVNQLRFARAASASPSAQGDWTVTVVDEVAVSCAGLCAGGTVCAEDGAGGSSCVTDSGDCGGSCDADTEVCVAGACALKVPDPPAHDIPEGVGLFADLAFLPDGRAVLAYYDRVATALVLGVHDGQAWSPIVLDDATTADTGMWADLTVDGSGIVHVAYQDALGDRLLYTSWDGSAPGAVEVVDDGVRPGDRAHPVGASASVFVDGAGVGIAYQDGATSDLVVARRGGSEWTRSDLLTGATLDGFFVATAVGGGAAWYASYFYDRAFFPPGDLAISTIP